ncbi:MAG: NUDIX domain-containing protein [Bacteroidota bacterium]
MVKVPPNTYAHENQLLLAVDCVIFGYQDGELKLLIFKREVEPLAGQWSLIGRIVEKNEAIEEAAHKVLKDITGLDKVFLEQLYSFGSVSRDPGARVVSIVYWSLTQSTANQEIKIADHEAQWVSFNEIPQLVLDHNQMVKMAIEKLREYARYRPIGFELLPSQFTLPQLLKVYEAIYQRKIDDRNFRKKMLASGLLIKLDKKDKSTSKKGAFLYKFDRKKYKLLLQQGYWFEV